MTSNPNCHPIDVELPTRVRGYDRDAVLALLRQNEWTQAETECRIIELEQELETVSQMLDLSRTELRYWHDRSIFVDVEAERARLQARQIEAEARDHAVKIVEEARREANRITGVAHDDVRQMHLKAVAEVERVQGEIDNVRALRDQLVSTLRTAMVHVEDGISEIEGRSRVSRISSDFTGAMTTLKATVVDSDAEQDKESQIGEAAIEDDAVIANNDSCDETNNDSGDETMFESADVAIAKLAAH